MFFVITQVQKEMGDFQGWISTLPGPLHSSRQHNREQMEKGQGAYNSFLRRPQIARASPLPALAEGLTQKG